MKYLALIFAILVVGCCPKVTEVPPKIITKRDSVTVYVSDTITVPGQSDTVFVATKSLCDSLLAKKSVTLRDSGSSVSVRIDVDDDGVARVITSCDSLAMVIDSLKTITTVTDTIRITETKVVTKYKKRRGKWWIWLLVGVCGGMFLSIMIRR